LSYPGKMDFSSKDSDKEAVSSMQTLS